MAPMRDTSGRRLALLWIAPLLGAAILGWWAGTPPAVTASDPAPAVVRVGNGDTATFPVAPGGQVAVPVSVVDGANLSTATLLLTYDPEQLQVVSCTAAPIVGADLSYCNPSYAPGIVRYSLLVAAGIDGSHPLFTVTFRALAAPGTAAALQLTAPHFADGQGHELSVTATGGTVSISGNALAAEAVFGVSPTSALVVPGQHTTLSVTLTVTDSRSVAAATLLLQYDPQVVRPVQCSPSAVPSLQGSCNPNFNLTAGLIKLNLLAESAVSGQLPLYDVTFEAAGAAAAGATSSVTATVEYLTDAHGQSLSWRAENALLTIAQASTNAALITVGPPTVEDRLTITQGMAITVPVWITGVTNLGAATIALNYDASLLRPFACHFLGNSASVDGGDCAVQSDRVLAYLAAGDGVSGNFPLFEVIFTAQAGVAAGTTSQLWLDALTFVDASIAPLAWRTRNAQLDFRPGDLSALPLISLGEPARMAPLPLAQDSTLSVTLAISGVTAFGAASIDIRYDPDVVTLVACQPVGTLDGNTCLGSEGQIKISVLSGDGFTGTTPVAVLVFRGADNARLGDQATLAMSLTAFFDIHGAPLLYQTQSATIEIVEPVGVPVAVTLRTGHPIYDSLSSQQFPVSIQAVVDADDLPQGLAVVTLRLQYDPTVVRPLAYTLNGIAFQAGGCNLEYAPDQIRLTLLAGAGDTGATGVVTLADIQFEAVGMLGALANLDLIVDQLLAADALPPTYRVEHALVQITRDADGIADAIEDAGPNDGDGNRDGLPDAEQRSVTSLPSPVSGKYVTVIGPPDSCLQYVRFVSNPSPADTPLGISFPLGFLSFTLGCIDSGSAVTVTVLLHDNADEQLDESFFYSYAAAGATGNGWLPFGTVSEARAAVAPDRITLQLADGERGDNDDVANGSIDFLGAPARAGVSIGINPVTLNLVEGGSPASYRLSILARPAAPITIDIGSGGQTNVNPTRIMLGLTDWSTVSVVSVTAIEDYMIEGNHSDKITHTVTSADPLFDGLAVADVAVAIGDSAVISGTATPIVTPIPTITPGGPTLTPTPTSPAGQTHSVCLPAVMVYQMTNPFWVYLPMIAQPELPDLVVEQVVRIETGIQVTLRNLGRKPVVDAFYVDGYFGPPVPPTAVNQTWETVGSEGMVWGVTTSALPLQPGAALTLATGDAYFLPEYSMFDLPLASDQPVYVQADSFGENTTYGAVLEVDEIAGQPYNNIYGPVFLPPGVVTATGSSAPTDGAPVGTGLPVRRQTSWLPPVPAMPHPE